MCLFTNDLELLLRPHTSAHQNELLRSGSTSFLVTGDVYRRDTIDRTHYPVFHQMEGVHIFPPSQLEHLEDESAQVEAVVSDMKAVLEGMAEALFGKVEMRWVSEYFPFTDPSMELEILFRGEWMEVLGCGVVHQQILTNCGLATRKGWAFGLGLERLAMVLFSIPDIRLFWSDDERFLSQFNVPSVLRGEIVPTFEPYSKYPATYRDVAFWIPQGNQDDQGTTYHENGFYEVVREEGGDVVEDVALVDEYRNPKSGRESVCYRINYRHMDRSLTNDEINLLQDRIRLRLERDLHVELR